MSLVKRISVELIKPHNKPIRSVRDVDKFIELKTSILQQGQLIPIKVRPIQDDEYQYEIVYGHRRFDAICEIGGIDGRPPTILAFVDDLNDDRVLTEALVENLIREDMTDLDKAKAIKAYMEMTGYSMRRAAQTLGISQSRISRLTALLQEPKEVLDLMDSPEFAESQYELAASANAQHNSDARGITSEEPPVRAHLSERHIREARKEAKKHDISEDERIEILKRSAQEGFSAKELSKFMKAYGKAPEEERPALLESWRRESDSRTVEIFCDQVRALTVAGDQTFDPRNLETLDKAQLAILKERLFFLDKNLKMWYGNLQEAAEV